MDSLTLFLNSRLGFACTYMGQGVLVAVLLGLPSLPAEANTFADGFDPEDTYNQQHPVSLLEKEVEIPGDRQRELPQEPPVEPLGIAETTTQSIADPTIITESTLAPFIPADASAALLLPDKVTESTVSQYSSVSWGADSNLLIPSSSIVTDYTADNEETDTDRVDVPEDGREMETDNPWTFKFQPYATVPLTSYGNSTVRGRTIDYHLNLGELLDILKIAASGRFEAWHRDTGFIIDGYYYKLGGNGIVSFQNLPNTTIENKLTTQQGIYDFAVSYRFGDTPPNRLPETPSETQYPLIWFEPYAGVRLNDIQAELNELTIRAGDTTISADFDRIDEDQGRTWFEPLLGGKLGMQLSDPISLWLRGDVSGFGIAGDKDLSWQVLGGIDWWVNRSISLQLGYKFYEIDYQNGSGRGAFGLNLNLNGPFLGATFYF